MALLRGVAKLDDPAIVLVIERVSQLHDDRNRRAPRLEESFSTPS